jgi:ABC-type hemin transport system ATPase subunit
MMVAHNITLKKNGREILNNLSVMIPAGVFTAIAGPNGAGKSSLLKILSNETGGYEGRVEVNGTPITKYDIVALSKVRAVLPQSTHLPCFFFFLSIFYL